MVVPIVAWSTSTAIIITASTTSRVRLTSTSSTARLVHTQGVSHRIGAFTAAWTQGAAFERHTQLAVAV